MYQNQARTEDGIRVMQCYTVEKMIGHIKPLAVQENQRATQCTSKTSLVLDLLKCALFFFCFVKVGWF